MHNIVFGFESKNHRCTVACARLFAVVLARALHRAVARAQLYSVEYMSGRYICNVYICNV